MQITKSATTREPRENNGILEQNGREYFFRDETEMLADIKAGNFLEAEVIAYRKDVTIGLYGGDVSRKDKFLAKQAKGLTVILSRASLSPS